MGVSMKLLASITSFTAYCEEIKWRFEGKGADSFDRLLLKIHKLNAMTIREYEKSHAEEIEAYEKRREEELQAKYDRGEVEDMGGLW